MLARRQFLIATGTAIAAFSLRAQGASAVPAILDHILLGAPDLQQGIDFVASQTGVRAAFGGVHPGRGTQNALLSLGERHYLEIIAPDPKQERTNVTPMFRTDLIAHLKSFASPRLVGWAAHPCSLSAYAQKLRAANVTFQGPTPGSRKRPDGRLLQWQTLNLDNDEGSLLPFFIEWSADSPHPASDAPSGCQLPSFELASPDLDGLREKIAPFDLDVTIAKGDTPQIRGVLRGPKGELKLTS
jgi:hypothetical protein